MCPISGMVQFLIVVVTLLLICHTIVVHSLKITFEPNNVTIHMYDTIEINYTLTGDPNVDSVILYTENPSVAVAEKTITINNQQLPFSGIFNLTGNFLGATHVRCKIAQNDEIVEGELPVIVIRKKRLIDTIFTASVATLVSIIYVNFGCALNWQELYVNIKRPIGPVIGFLGQFLIMPLLSFGLGKILFPHSAEMQLGMFFTGVSPAGGASNIWTLILDGNVDLSITMTTISTFAAFLMMPLWLFTLGKLIFDQGKLIVPYEQIATYAFALVIPLAIGYLISRHFKRVAQFLVRILKMFSGILILFIVVFAIVTNLYLFKLFSWEIIIAGMGLPYLGFISAYGIAKALKQPKENSLAIAIETSIQNTGISIFLLRFTLPQPQADLTTVVPVSVAIMTPIPFILIFLYKKITHRLSTSHEKLNLNRETSSSFVIDNNFNNDNRKTAADTIITDNGR